MRHPTLAGLQAADARPLALILPAPVDLGSFFVEVAWHVRYRSAPAPRRLRALIGEDMTDLNPLVAPIHSKAMLVLLNEEDEERWLTCSFDDAVALAKPFPSQLMTV